MERFVKSGTPILDGVTPDFRKLLEQCPVAYTQTYAKTFSKTPKGKFKETIQTLQKYLSQGCKQYYIYPEFTLQGEIHYHGFIQSINECDYQKMLPKLKQFGYIYMKAIDNYPIWIDYCQKHKKDMEQLLGITLPITHHTLFKNKNSSAGNNEGGSACSVSEKATGEPSPTGEVAQRMSRSRMYDAINDSSRIREYYFNKYIEMNKYINLLYNGLH